MVRLPISGKDAGSWGDILNSFLLTEHNADGTLKRAGQISGAQQVIEKGVANGYAGLDNNAKVLATALPDASTSARGIVRLAGDLSGSALSPTVKNIPRVFNVKDFGATGNGVADDTMAIQAAVTAAVGGGIVHIPEGVYVVDPVHSIHVSSGMVLQGVGYGSIIKVKNGSNVLNNLIKVEDCTNVVLRDLQIDGNRPNQSGSESVATHYGIYIAGSQDCRVENVWAHHTTGVGIHIYNCEGVIVTHCDSSHNRYHGFECEQATGCIFTTNRGHHNDRHGIFVSPGELGGLGAIANVIDANSFDHNGNYGIALGIAAGNDGSIGLTRDNVITNNSVVANTFYGINLFTVDDTLVANNTIVNNGAFGIYLYKAQRNQIISNRLHNNSQSSNGAYDELLLEGAADGRASKDNLIVNNFIQIDADVKANWAIREATSNDGANQVAINFIPQPGVSGRAHVQHTATSFNVVDLTTNQSITGVKTFNNGLVVNPNATLPGSSMGLDAPFGNAAFRMFSDVGNLQYVAPNGNADWYIGGNNSLSVTAQKTIVWGRLRLAATATPSSAGAAGEVGDVAWDTDYVYMCVAVNTWKRAALTAW